MIFQFNTFNYHFNKLTRFIEVYNFSILHKIPFIGKILKKLSIKYGKYTWWQYTVLIITIVRKIVVVASAIIGVFAVFSTINFSSDNIIAGIFGMGATYVEMLSSITRRMFNRFLNLFDHKIVPNVPNNPPIP